MKFERKQQDISLPKHKQPYPIWTKQQLDNCRAMLDGCLNRMMVTDSKEEVTHLYRRAQLYIVQVKQQAMYHFYNQKQYVTVVGSRKADDEAKKRVFTKMTEYKGRIFRSGNAPGIDQLVSHHILPPQREIYLPYEGFGDNARMIPVGESYIPNETWPNYEEAKDIVYRLHPLGHKLPHTFLPYLIRDVYQVLGIDLHTPSEKVLCWTPDGAQCAKECTKDTGGTAMAIRVADAYGIPVENVRREY